MRTGPVSPTVLALVWLLAACGPGGSGPGAPETETGDAPETGSTDLGGSEMAETETETGEDEEQLCLASGGEWAGNCGGHFICGEPSCRLCLDIGCDCGYWANFVEGQGCVDDPACAPSACESDADCSAQEVCNFGCCEGYPDNCVDPLVIDWAEGTGCVDISVEPPHIGGRVFTDCGSGWDEVQSCAEGPGVVWTSSGVSLCGAACDAFEAVGRIRMFGGGCWGPCAEPTWPE